MRVVNSNGLHAIASALVLFIVLAGSAKAAELTVSDAWIRALPEGLPAGGYFTLHNESGRTVTLIGASSPACRKMELHKSTSTGGMSGMGGMGGMGGMSTMEDVAKIDVPARGTLRFAPGGYHIMCINPNSAIQPGANVPVTLTFGDGTSVVVAFAVRSATGR